MIRYSTIEQRWIFEPAAQGGTNVEYHVDFKFRSRALQMLMSAAFSDRTVATLAAFKRRADQLYDDRSRPGSNNA